MSRKKYSRRNACQCSREPQGYVLYKDELRRDGRRRCRRVLSPDGRKLVRGSGQPFGCPQDLVLHPHDVCTSKVGRMKSGRDGVPLGLWHINQRGLFEQPGRTEGVNQLRGKPPGAGDVAGEVSARLKPTCKGNTCS